MPSQLIHLQICADALGRSPGSPGDARDARTALQAHGPGLPDRLYLGAIAPDAWSVAGLSRGTTHFWAPTDDTSGVVRLANTHPALAQPAGLPLYRRAFLAGYLCHLVTDEQWTFTVYRPYFGRHSSLQASPEARRLQLALQCLMEQQLRDGRRAELAGWLAALARAPADAGLPFIADESVAAWRDLQVQAAGKPTAPAAFDHVLRHGDRPDSTVTADALAGDWPSLASRAAAHVPASSLATFQERATGACAAILGAWLPLPD